MKERKRCKPHKIARSTEKTVRKKDEYKGFGVAKRSVTGSLDKVR